MERLSSMDQPSQQSTNEFSLLRTYAESWIHLGWPVDVTVLDHDIDVANVSNVANVVRWITAHQNHVGKFTWSNRAEFLVLVHDRCRFEGRHPKDFIGRDSRLVIDLKLTVEGVAVAGTGARDRREPLRDNHWIGRWRKLHE